MSTIDDARQALIDKLVAHDFVTRLDEGDDSATFEGPKNIAQAIKALNDAEASTTTSSSNNYGVEFIC